MVQGKVRSAPLAPLPRREEDPQASPTPGQEGAGAQEEAPQSRYSSWRRGIAFLCCVEPSSTLIKSSHVGPIRFERSVMSEPGKMSAESLPHWRMSTRSASRQVAEPPSAIDSDTSSSVSSPGSQSTSSSYSPFSTKKETNKAEVPTATQDESATQDHDSTTQDNASATQENDTSTQDEPISQSSGSMAQASGSNPLPPSSPATSLSRDSSSFCGGTYRKRKANFSNEETETLVKNVVKHFSALYGLEAIRTESTRRNQRRSQLWNEIQRHVNELGYTPRNIDDLKHKWRDIRLEVKRKVTTKRPALSTSTAASAFDNRLTPMEELVASTIGQSHLDGEHDGVYHEPGLPRQSIFYPLRGLSATGETSRGEKPTNLVTPKPEPTTQEISVMTPAILTTTSQTPAILTATAQITFLTMAEAAVPEKCAIDVSQSADIDKKPTPDTLRQGEEEAGPSLLAGPHNGDAGPCDSQSSMVSSPAGSPGQLTTQPDWGNEGRSDKPTSVKGADQAETLTFKMEEEDDDPGEGGSQEVDVGSLRSEPVPSTWKSQEWEQQSGSPQRSENAREDSLHSSASQEGTQTPATDVPVRDGCSCLLEDRRTMWRTNMHRLLELEEQWDQLYHQELSMWEEERLQQREQRMQDRLLQQQLLSVLTDIRDDLKQMREQRATSRESHAVAGLSQGSYAQQTSAPDPSTPGPAVAVTANGDSASCSPSPKRAKSWSLKTGSPRGRPPNAASASWLAKSVPLRGRPPNSASVAWSPKSVSPRRRGRVANAAAAAWPLKSEKRRRSTGRPRGRPRKHPIVESNGEGQS